MVACTGGSASIHRPRRGCRACSRCVPPARLCRVSGSGLGLVTAADQASASTCSSCAKLHRVCCSGHWLLFWQASSKILVIRVQILTADECSCSCSCRPETAEHCWRLMAQSCTKLLRELKLKACTLRALLHAHLAPGSFPQGCKQRSNPPRLQMMSLIQTPQPVT